jgi:CHAT domain-containing protein
MRQSGVALTGGQSTLQAWGRGEFPDPSNDGILTAEEVAGLDLDGTWLVTLSACETGVGQVQSGEGVFGLRRAFMMAGAQNLLMTLWPVSDETTPKIMADFYREALKTGDAAGSLAKVQRDWLVKLRNEKGLLAAVRDAGPFAMVVMANPNLGKTAPASQPVAQPSPVSTEATPAAQPSPSPTPAQAVKRNADSQKGRVTQISLILLNSTLCLLEHSTGG